MFQPKLQRDDLKKARPATAHHKWECTSALRRSWWFSPTFLHKRGSQRATRASCTKQTRATQTSSLRACSEHSRMSLKTKARRAAPWTYSPDQLQPSWKNCRPLPCSIENFPCKPNMWTSTRKTIRDTVVSKHKLKRSQGYGPNRDSATFRLGESSIIFGCLNDDGMLSQANRSRVLSPQAVHTSQRRTKWIYSLMGMYRVHTEVLISTSKYIYISAY